METVTGASRVCVHGSSLERLATACEQLQMFVYVCVCVLLVVLLNVNHLFSVNLSLNGSPSVLRLNAPIHVTQTTMCSSAAFLC